MDKFRIKGIRLKFLKILITTSQHTFIPSYFRCEYFFLSPL